MNKDDLLKILDLSGKDARSEEAESLPLTPAGTHPVSFSGPTALELDSWSVRRGEELLAESERLQALGLCHHAVADFHAAAFLPEPVLLEGCSDRLRHAFLTQLLGTPEFNALHADTALCEAASEIAAAAFAEQFAELKKEQARGASGGEAAEMAALRAAGKALASAEDEVSRMREAANALGLGPGSPGSNDAGAIASLYRRVRGSPALRKICELAGRFRRVAQSRQRMKSVHGIDDVAGVTAGGDLGRLLPVELAKLALPETEWVTLRRLAERQCMQLEVRATEPAGKGPVIVSVDESGSMMGDKAHTAKALALAVAWVARRQRRWCALVAYSGDSGERLLALPPGRWDEAALCGWLEAFIGKGSSIDVPVREMPRIFQQLKAPAGRTDLLFITDARCRLPDEVKSRFLDWKTFAKARLATLVIGGEPGDLASVSDSCHTVATLSPAEEAVGEALSF